MIIKLWIKVWHTRFLYADYFVALTCFVLFSQFHHSFQVWIMIWILNSSFHILFKIIHKKLSKFLKFNRKIWGNGCFCSNYDELNRDRLFFSFWVQFIRVENRIIPRNSILFRFYLSLKRNKLSNLEIYSSS